MPKTLNKVSGNRLIEMKKTVFALTATINRIMQILKRTVEEFFENKTNLRIYIILSARLLEVIQKQKKLLVS